MQWTRTQGGMNSEQTKATNHWKTPQTTLQHVNDQALARPAGEGSKQWRKRTPNTAAMSMRGGIRGRTTSPRTSEKRRGTRRKAPTKDKKQHPARRHSCTSRHLGRKTAPACDSEMTSEQNKYENNRKHRRTPHEEAGTNAQAWLTNRQDAHK